MLARRAVLSAGRFFPSTSSVLSSLSTHRLFSSKSKSKSSSRHQQTNKSTQSSSRAGKHSTLTAATSTHTPAKENDKPTQPDIPTFYNGMLARDFVSTSLYASGQGYFNSAPRVYSTGVEVPQSLSFNDIPHDIEYMTQLDKLYKAHDDCWLTPVEIFKPYFAQSIAKWLIQTRIKALGEESVPPNTNTNTNTNERTAQAHSSTEQHPAEPTTIDSTTNADKTSETRTYPPLHIYEMGGGNGTCALGILDYIQENYPELYKVTHYTIIELSEYMAYSQTFMLPKHIANGKVTIRNISILQWNEKVEEGAFFIGLEVLDNMPHDHLIQGPNNELLQGHVFAYDNDHGNVTKDDVDETGAVVTRRSGLGSEESLSYYEKFKPISDPYIIQWGQLSACFDRELQSRKTDPGSFSNQFALKMTDFSQSLRRMMDRDQNIFVPTTCLMFLDVLKKYFPKHHLLLADFSSLQSTVSGINAPVVSSKSRFTRGKPKDYPTFLVELGVADIFHPTDFWLLKHMYEVHVLGMKPLTEQQKEKEAAAEQSAEKDQPTITNASSSNQLLQRPMSEMVDPIKGEQEGKYALVPRVLSQYEFMCVYAAEYEAKTRLKDGWNPLFKDYANFHFFLS